MYTIFPLRALYLEHSQLAFDFVVIACSLDFIRPGLAQGCKALNVLLGVRPTPLNMVCMP